MCCDIIMQASGWLHRQGSWAGNVGVNGMWPPTLYWIMFRAESGGPEIWHKLLQV